MQSRSPLQAITTQVGGSISIRPGVLLTMQADGNSCSTARRVQEDSSPSRAPAWPLICRMQTPLLAPGWRGDSGSGLRAGDVGRHLTHKFLKVAQALQP